MKNISKTSKGFTLIEALAAVLLLTLGLTPLLMVGSAASNVAFSIQNNVIASNLAQEGIEVVRAIRDTNWVATPVRGFDASLSPSGVPAFDCTTACLVEWNSDVLLPFLDTPLKIDSNGIYNYTLGTASFFKRKITITKPSTVELKIISEVTWQERARLRKVTIEDHLFDWK